MKKAPKRRPGQSCRNWLNTHYPRFIPALEAGMPAIGIARQNDRNPTWARQLIQMLEKEEGPLYTRRCPRRTEKFPYTTLATRHPGIIKTIRSGVKVRVLVAEWGFTLKSAMRARHIVFAYDEGYAAAVRDLGASEDTDTTPSTPE